MMKVLLHNQWKILVNTVRSQPKKNYISYLVMLGVITVLLYFVSKGVLEIGESISENVMSGLLSYGFLMVIGFIILLGLPQIFKHLFAATDLNLLFTMPIPTKNIFWIKYLQSFIGTPLMVFLLFIVPIYLYGIIIEANLLYYPVVFLVLTSITVIGQSLAYLFNLILVQVVPASRANEFMTVMSVLSGILVYLMFMIPNLTSELPLTERLLAGLPLFPKWVPVTWGSNAILAAKDGSIDLIVPLVMILLLASLFILVSLILVDKGFRTGWIRLSESGGKKKKKKSNLDKSKVFIHHPIIAIGKKEWYSIKRDIREWLVFMPIIFFFVFGFIGFLSGGANISDIQGPNEITWPIAQGIFLFIYAMFNGQIASTAIAREARSYWILQVLPLSGKDISFGKLWISWLIPFVILTVIEIIIGTLLGWSLIQFVSGIALKGVITVGISGIGLWLGTIGAKYNPANPQNRLRFSISIILLISSYIYLILALIPYILLMIPVTTIDFIQEVGNEATGFIGFVANIIFTVLTWKAEQPLLVGAIGIVIMLFISLGVSYIFTLASARKIDKGIEIEIVRDTNSKSLFNKKTGVFNK
ncbi:putative ABC transporter permease subunit [Aquibacillus rhizosphaerae]|uniref:ABC transporter permease n=1 Tax=Aquibacillus rhizosphaerae TaxID=3051431 RepID=A0ABT7L1B2_9BACI|nr:hypothetical protein [Aquibacillus sp. LR5S19]MDL4839643.1 hypothetical protein [Aquibacillus sp. LR5S19]